MSKETKYPAEPGTMFYEAALDLAVQWVEAGLANRADGSDIKDPWGPDGIPQLANTLYRWQGCGFCLADIYAIINRLDLTSKSGLKDPWAYVCSVVWHEVKAKQRSPSRGWRS